MKPVQFCNDAETQGCYIIPHYLFEVALFVMYIYVPGTPTKKAKAKFKK